jgi:hypothetical protein
VLTVNVCFHTAALSTLKTLPVNVNVHPMQGFFSELWRKQNGQVPQLMLLQQTLGGAPTPDRNPLTSATGGEMATLDADVLGLGDLGCGDGRGVSIRVDQGRRQVQNPFNIRRLGWDIRMDPG